MSNSLEKTDTQVRHEESASPAPELYRHKFFSSEGAAGRKALVPALIVPLIFNAILLWACLSLFLGSLLNNNDISKIHVAAVNLDDGSFGEGLINRLKGSLQAPGPHFRWSFLDKTSAPANGVSLSKSLVLYEKAWAVLEISANASSNFQEALSRGDASYDPLSAATLYFASARNQITTGAVTLPPLIGLITAIVSKIAVNTTALFLHAQSDGRIPASALQCPQCLVSPFAVKQVDLIPFTPAVSFGTLNTGLIFLLTFTFNVFTLLRAGAETHGHLFNLRTHIVLRTVSSLSAYSFLSLMYALGVLAFGIPLTGHYATQGAGFMALWMLSWCTMGACGLIMEFVFTIIGMQWAPFFLNIWLITNASGAFATFELMVGFYKYGYAVPFYHAIQATRTIMFGTKSHLELNFGVLIAWMLVGWAGICATTVWRIRQGKKTGVHRVP